MTAKRIQAVHDQASPFRCPVCKKSVAKGVENFPFCCDRCRLIDLGSWAAGDYRIAGEPAHMINDSDSDC